MSNTSLQAELFKAQETSLLFSKYEGAGNDFILIDDRQKTFPIKEVPRFCHRKFGIGADGVLLLQTDSRADFLLRIFNSDGSEAESCGNGLRCFLQFIADLGFPKKRYSIAVGERIVFGEFEGNQISIDMGAPKGMRLHLKTDFGEVHFIDTGVPHVVYFVSDVETADLKTIGATLRHHSLFQPRGANVNLVALQKDGSLRVRVYERGVEGETLACGTGAVAVAAIVQEVHGPRAFYPIHFPGGKLIIREKGGHFWMSGPANRVFRGFFSL